MYLQHNLTSSINNLEQSSISILGYKKNPSTNTIYRYNAEICFFNFFLIFGCHNGKRK